MPIAVICPECRTRLNAPDSAAGRRIPCSNCRAAIEVPDADEPPRARPASSARPAPLVRRPADDEDDEPRRPTRSKARRDDDEDDDRPRRRRREEDDDDNDDDYPRRKTKKKSSGGFLGHPVVMVVGGLLGVAAAAGILYAMWSGRKAEEQRLKDEAAAQRIMDSDPLYVPPARPQSTGKGSATPVASVPAGWRSFAMPNSPLTVAVPGEPTPIAVPAGSQQPGVTVSGYQLEHNQKRYQITMFTHERTGGGGHEGTLDLMCDQFVRTAGLGAERSRANASIGGHPGRQLVFGGQVNAIVRLTGVRGRTYILAVMSQNPLSPNDASVAPFFDSARIAN